MKLYNKNIDSVQNILYFDNNGIKYVDKLTEVELNTFGYYFVEGDQHYSRFSNSAPSGSLVFNKYIITYNQIDKPLEEVKQLMLMDLKDTFLMNSERPKVTVTLESTQVIEVDGGREDIKNFEIGKKYSLPQVKATNGIFYDLTLTDYDTIINAIELNGITLYQTKWNKENEINNLLDVTACALYEATPYDDNGTIKYKNNVKEW